MAKLGRSVAMYHPEILVRRSGKVVAIKADMDDWYDDAEVLGKLAAANPQCRTVGELVEAIEGDGGVQSQKASGVVSCCIGVCAQISLDSVREWDEPI